MKNYDLNMDGYISLEDFEKIAANFPFSFCTHESDRWDEVFNTLKDATTENKQGCVNDRNETDIFTLSFKSLGSVWF